MAKRVKYWKAGLVLSSALVFFLAAAVPSGADSLTQAAQSYIAQYGTTQTVITYSPLTTTSSGPGASQGSPGGTTSGTGSGSSSSGGAWAPASLPSVSAIVAAFNSSYTLLPAEEQLLGLINQQRVANHLPAFTVNLKLSDLARWRAEDMAVHQELTHYLPDYGTPPQMEEAAGIYANPFGAENICEGPSVTVDNTALFNSAPHRANLLDPRETQIGLGVVRSANGIVWISELFLGN